MTDAGGSAPAPAGSASPQLRVLLKKKTVPDLIEECKAAGISGYSNKRKEELIDLLVFKKPRPDAQAHPPTPRAAAEPPAAAQPLAAPAPVVKEESTGDEEASDAWTNDEDPTDEADGVGHGGKVTIAQPEIMSHIISVRETLVKANWQPRPTQSIVPQPRESFRGSSHAAIYKSQEDAGKLMFEKILSHLGASDAPSALAGKFDRLDVFILLANFTTLHAQTLVRWAHFIKWKQSTCPAFFSEFPDGVGVGRHVFRASQSKENKAVFDRLLRSAADPKTLVLMIHDEAHFAGTAGGAVDGYLNDSRLRSKSNVVQLLVSATPYNLQTCTSQIPSEHEVDWPNAEGPGESASYYGLNSFCSASRDGAAEGVVKGDRDFEKHCKTVLATHFTRGGKRERDNAAKAGRRDALIEEYICAMMLHEGVGVEADYAGKVSPLTKKIVDDLLDIPLKRGDGSGIMVVLRVSPEQGHVHGRLVKAKLEEARDGLALKGRFAVILDVGSNSARMADSIGSELLQRMRAWNRHSQPRFTTIDPRSYEELLDLPVILILCERGKMGDSFPKSFRHYDLRLRYSGSCESRAAVEQDLGRAFRYGPATAEYPHPTILVGKECAAELSKQKVDLLRLDPDPKMVIRRWNNSTSAHVVTLCDGAKIGAARPETVAQSSEVYRKYWKCADREAVAQRHYDWREDGLCANRFLLQGRPQIGKTGAFLHLIELLFDSVQGSSSREVAPPIPCPVPGTDLPPESKPKPRINNENMGLFPCFEAVRAEEFGHPPCAGKYGDPADPNLWKYYVDEGQKAIHPCAPAKSTAGRLRRERAPASGATELSEMTENGQRDDGVTGEGGLPPQQPPGCTNYASKAWSASAVAGILDWKSLALDSEYRVRHSGTVAASAGQLWMSEACMAKWWRACDDGSSLVMHSAAGPSGPMIKFPVLVPSSERWELGLLDLQGAMVVSGHLGVDYRRGARAEYLQIVAVKQREAAKYRECCNDSNVVLFELPPSADDLGIGASRYHMKRLATRICRESFPFCFFLDDSVHSWKGVTLPDDPEPMFGELARSAATTVDLSLADVLLHFQSRGFVDGDLRRFGMIGFARFDGYLASEAAYSRQHVYSAVIMNLEVLREIEYNDRCHVWEDLDFNKRASDAGIVLCKCYRFVMLKKPGMPGGASYMVAREEASDLLQLQREIERLERKLETLKGELQELKKSAAAKLSFGDPEALYKARLSVGSKQAEKTDCEARLTKARVELRQLLEAEISERRGHLEEWKAEYNRLRCELETAIDTEVVFERLTKLEGDRELVAPKLAHLIELKATLDATIACNSG